MLPLIDIMTVKELINTLDINKDVTIIDKDVIIVSTSVYNLKYNRPNSYYQEQEVISSGYIGGAYVITIKSE